MRPNVEAKCGLGLLSNSGMNYLAEACGMERRDVMKHWQYELSHLFPAHAEWTDIHLDPLYASVGVY